MFQRIEAKPYHCGQIVRALRPEHCEAIGISRSETHRALRSTYDASALRWAWRCEGRLAGLAGVVGSLAGTRGFVWLALSEEASRHPHALIKACRRQLAELDAVKDRLDAVLLSSDEKSVRLAKFLGFRVQALDAGYQRAIRDRATDHLKAA